jgi:hypothetical protein
MGRALTMWVDNFDALFAIFSIYRKDSNREIKRDQDSIITPKAYPNAVSSYFPTLLHPRLSAGVFSLAHRDSFSLLFTESTKQRHIAVASRSPTCNK